MKRFVISALVVLSCVGIGYNYSSQVPTQEVTYTVKSGDTLYDIVKSEYGESVNAQEMIYQIREDNHLENSNIKPGMTIILKK